jgi:tRNA-specific 2-thiouridylase
VGQRKGLGISSPDPLYVLKIHPDSHRVEVGPDAALLSRTLRANRLNWVSIAPPDGPVRVAIKIRHRHEPAMATLTVLEDDLVEAIFDESQRAITPGQSAVFYQGDEVAGGGWIV